MPGGMVVSTVWVLAGLGESNLKRAGRTVPPDTTNFNHPPVIFAALIILDATRCGYME